MNGGMSLLVGRIPVRDTERGMARTLCDPMAVLFALSHFLIGCRGLVSARVFQSVLTWIDLVYPVQQLFSYQAFSSPVSRQEQDVHQA